MNRISCLLIVSSVLLPALGLAQTSTQVDFKTDVAPIFEEHCIKCHFGGSTHADLEITSRQKLLDQRAIVPGKPDQSVLYNTMKNGLMPPPGLADARSRAESPGSPKGRLGQPMSNCIRRSQPAGSGSPDRRRQLRKRQKRRTYGKFGTVF